MKRVTFLTALLICSLLAACGPSAPAATPTPEPTPTPVEIVADSVEDIVGIWVVPGSYYVQFLADGTLRVAASLERLESSTIRTGTFWFEGTVFNTIDTVAADPGKYEVRCVQQGGETVGLRWQVIEEPNPGRKTYYRGLTPRASGQ